MHSLRPTGNRAAAPRNPPTGSGIVIISEPISRLRVAEMAAERFGDMVKAVVDTNRRVLALGGDLHSDEVAALLERGSALAELWGITYRDSRSPRHYKREHRTMKIVVVRRR